MIIECDLPFHVIQKDAFKNFCTTLDPKYYVPSNRKMIKLAGAISAELTLPSGRNKVCTSIIFRDGHIDEKGVYVLVSCNNCLFLQPENTCSRACNAQPIFSRTPTYIYWRNDFGENNCKPMFTAMEYKP